MGPKQPGVSILVVLSQFRFLGFELQEERNRKFQPISISSNECKLIAFNHFRQKSFIFQNEFFSQRR